MLCNAVLRSRRTRLDLRRPGGGSTLPRRLPSCQTDAGRDLARVGLPWFVTLSDLEATGNFTRLG